MRLFNRNIRAYPIHITGFYALFLSRYPYRFPKIVFRVVAGGGVAHGILASVLYIPKSIVDYAVMVGNQSRGQRIVIGKRRGRIGGKHHGLYPVCRHTVQVGSLIHVGIVPAKTVE